MAKDLYIALSKTLEDYSKEVQDEVEGVAEEVAEEIAQELKQNSPKKTGKYARGWRLKKESQPGVGARYIVHNATSGQLTHLLEFGHSTLNGGRTKAQPHIAPAERKAQESFVNKLEKVLRG